MLKNFTDSLLSTITPIDWIVYLKTDVAIASQRIEREQSRNRRLTTQELIDYFRIYERYFNIVNTNLTIPITIIENNDDNLVSFFKSVDTVQKYISENFML